MSTQRQGRSAWRVVALVSLPVIAVVTLLRILAWDPGSAGAITFLVVWTLLCLLLAPLLRTKPTPRLQDLADPQTYGNELRELTRSRRDIVQAFEIERRRIERDLHDGAQQYIVAASMQVGEASLLLDDVRGADAARLDEESHRMLDEASSLLSRAQDTVDEALAELRRTVAGIHPKVLSDIGLEAAVRDIASRSGLDVAVRVPHPLPDMPEGVVAAAYFLVSEALTNVAKHAPDASVTVLLAADQYLQVSVVDTGPGGAELRSGHGLAGMRERLLAFGGTLQVSSPVGGPTTVATRLPLLLYEGEPSIVFPHEADPQSGESK